MDIDEAKKERKEAKRKFTRLETIIKENIIDGVLPRVIDRRFKELNEKWQGVQEAHDKVVSFIEEEDKV